MPSYQDHLLVGSVVVLVFALVAGPVLAYSWEAVVVSAGFILLAAVFPDVDHSGSVVHQRLRALLMVLAGGAAAAAVFPAPLPMLLAGAGAAGLAAAVFAAVKPRHRTVTHTVHAAAVFAAAVAAVSAVAFGTWVPGVFAFLAYLSHIALDRVV